jgi:hypothetical protein
MKIEMSQEDKNLIKLLDFVCNVYNTNDDLNENVVDKIYDLQIYCERYGINFDRCLRAANCYFDVDKAIMNSKSYIETEICTNSSALIEERKID